MAKKTTKKAPVNPPVTKPTIQERINLQEDQITKLKDQAAALNTRIIANQGYTQRLYEELEEEQLTQELNGEEMPTLPESE